MDIEIVARTSKALQQKRASILLIYKPIRLFLGN